MDYDHPERDATRTAELRLGAIESERAHLRSTADVIATLEDRALHRGWRRGFCFGVLTVVVIYYLYLWIWYG